jgi:hypothetical protein
MRLQTNRCEAVLLLKPHLVKFTKFTTLNIAELNLIRIIFMNTAIFFIALLLILR